MSKKHIKVCTSLDYIGNFLILVLAVTGYISVSAIPSLLGISIGITSSTIRLEICVITAVIKKDKSIIKNKKKKHDKIVLLPKTKLKSLEVLISKAFINSYNSHKKFV